MNHDSFDPQWIPAAKAGDQNAITRLYEATYQEVYLVIYSMLHSDIDTILDLLQDAYIKAFQHLDQLEDPSKFPAWVKQIARNKTLDFIKKSKPFLFSELSDEGDIPFEIEDKDIYSLPEAAADRKETSRLIREILDALPEGQRAVIAMYYFQELSVREIAEALERSENTVKVQLRNGRRSIEAKILELEKKEGIKLYSLAPLPFFLMLLHNAPPVEVVPDAAVLGEVIQAGSTAAAATTAAGTAGSAASAAGTAGIKTVVKTGAKVLAAKITAGVLAATVAVGGVAIVSNIERTEAAESVSEATILSETALTEPESTPASVSMEREAYEQILMQYREVLGVDSEVFWDAPDNYFHSDYIAIRAYHISHDTQFFYTYFDINADGTEELLIGVGKEDSVQVTEIYGLLGTQIVNIINAPNAPDLSKIVVFKDGTIFTFIGTGWGGYFRFYSLSRTSPVLKEEIAALQDWETLEYTINGNVYEEKDYRNYVDRLEEYVYDPGNGMEFMWERIMD